MWRFDGSLELARPLTELATVFDMCGLISGLDHGRGQALVAEGEGVRLEVTRVTGQRCRISGELDASMGREDASAQLLQIAMALEADGISFELRLKDAQDQPTGTFTPIG
jgi:hypothetical protein